MYDGKSQLLIENPINRYLINSPMLPSMKKNTDGSLTIYIQKDSPGKTKEANWLPAPHDTIYLVMRLYWPKDTPPSILPAGDGTWKPRRQDVPTMAEEQERQVEIRCDPIPAVGCHCPLERSGCI